MFSRKTKAVGLSRVLGAKEMILNLSLKNSNNIGDAVCAPCQYLPLGGIHLDLEKAEHPEADTIIFGGGAIATRAGLYKTNARRILWGAGSSAKGLYGPKNITHVNKGFRLYGCRDWGHGEWVACASCLSPLFDNIPDPIQDKVYYGHADIDPMELNNDCMDFEKVLMYLSKGETIITSSYHGMYWGYLLGRKVIVKPFSSKFWGLPWGMSEEKGIKYNNALSEARESNLNFYEKVKGYL